MANTSDNIVTSSDARTRYLTTEENVFPRFLWNAFWNAFGTQMERERSVRLIIFLLEIEVPNFKRFFSRKFSIFSKFRSQNFNKKCAQNAGNRISKALDFKIFRGRIPPDPPTYARFWRYASVPPTSYPGLHGCLRCLKPWDNPNLRVI